MNPEDKPIVAVDLRHKHNHAPQFAVGPFGSVSGTKLFVAIMAVIVIGLGIAAALMQKHFQEVESASVNSSAGEAAHPAPPSPAPEASASKTSAPPAVATKAGQQRFSSPSEASMPTGDYGKVIRLGENVFMDTKKYAAKFVGNDLSCANCHLDAGRKPGSAPLWASFIHYPAFRSKTGKVDTLASRI